MVNEIAQWVVLLFIAVFVVGLTRHLGQFLVSQRQQLADEYGPGVGSRLPDVILNRENEARLRELVAGAVTPWSLVAVVNEQCDACDVWLDELAQHGSPANAPLIIVTGRSGDEHRARLEELADFVVVDETGDRLREANLRATPFLMIVDDELRVRYQQVSGGMHDGVATWRAKRKDKADVPDLAVVAASNGGAQR